ncbi:MAG: AMP-binding protein [Paludibacteraceae bacterium]|nr:AMP-binding protein [Paludibacteraceae bacterium]
MNHYLTFIQNTIKNYWDEPALSDYITGYTLTYGQMAEKVAELHILFEEAGIKKGDKVALCGRNSANWAVSFMAVTTYEAVAVSILAEFSPESVHSLVNHSDAKLFLVGDQVWKTLDAAQMPNLNAIICMQTFEVLAGGTKELSDAAQNLEAVFMAKYKDGFGPVDVNYPTDNWDKPALINYTSGTTSDPKGVVLSYKAISSNIQFGEDGISNHPGWSMVSMLPLAHMFGLAFECLYQLAGGCHVYFLGKAPSPQVLMKAFSDVHPYMVLTVPLVVEKIFQKSVFPKIKKPFVRELWYLPGIGGKLRKSVHDAVMKAFGGNLKHLIIGGAALNHDVEKCLKQIKFPYTVGYGMTECGPILGYEAWDKFVERSCGKAVDRMEVSIDSADPHKIVGEILVKGDNLMTEYYKNPDATKAAFNKEGWLRTGDLGIIDKEGNIFIRGRNKSVIVGASGQNIYPEEIEGKLNNIPGVSESIVVDRGGKLTALVFPDLAALKDELANKSIEEILENIKLQVNRMIPAFCRLTSIEKVDKEFEKTPKRSIKRFLYK